MAHTVLSFTFHHFDWSWLGGVPFIFEPLYTSFFLFYILIAFYPEVYAQESCFFASDIFSILIPHIFSRLVLNSFLKCVFICGYALTWANKNKQKTKRTSQGKGLLQVTLSCFIKTWYSFQYLGICAQFPFKNRIVLFSIGYFDLEKVQMPFTSSINYEREWVISTESLCSK